MAWGGRQTRIPGECVQRSSCLVLHTEGRLAGWRGRDNHVVLSRTNYSLAALISAWSFLLSCSETAGKNLNSRSSHRGTAETKPTRNHKVVGSIPGLAQWVKDLALTWTLDPVLLYLRCGPAATALIGSLAWEPPYASGAALKKTKY